MRLVKPIVKFLWEEDGTTAVEYAVMLMLILLAVITAVQFFGASTSDSFDDSSTALSGALGN